MHFRFREICLAKVYFFYFSLLFLDAKHNWSIQNILFSTMNTKKTDMEVELIKRFHCECGRSYSKGPNLKYHKKWECGQKLQCDKCYKVFYYRSHWIRHTKICDLFFNKTFTT